MDTRTWTKDDYAEMKHNLANYNRHAKKLRSKTEERNKVGKELDIREDTIQESFKMVSDMVKYFNDNPNADDDATKAKPSESYRNYLLNRTGNFEE